jgi:hypothetical protein
MITLDSGQENKTEFCHTNGCDLGIRKPEKILWPRMFGDQKLVIWSVSKLASVLLGRYLRNPKIKQGRIL